MTVRRATPADVSAIAALLGELGYPVEPGAVSRRLEQLPESTTVLVADEGEVVGLAAVDVRHGLQHDGPRGQIVALVVREDARGRGIARTLLAAVEATARERGAVHLHVTSAAHRADAHAAYRALGFADTGLRFGKEL